MDIYSITVVKNMIFYKIAHMNKNTCIWYDETNFSKPTKKYEMPWLHEEWLGTLPSQLGNGCSEVTKT